MVDVRLKTYLHVYFLIRIIMTLKERFLKAVITGDLGRADEFGIIVSLFEFKNYFKDIDSSYINTFLAAAVIETGQNSITHTKYLFRMNRGEYLLHPDVIEEHQIIKRCRRD